MDGSVDYYGAWNGARGYLHFYGFNGGTDFSNGLYYVHGRWWNPATRLFMSPDDKGEYLYGSGDDAVNWAWARLQEVGQVGGEFIAGAGNQIILTNSDALVFDVHFVYPNEELYYNYLVAREDYEEDLPDTTMFRAGHIVGGIAAVVQGIGETGVGLGIGTGGTVGACLATVEVGCLPGAGAGVVAGGAVVAHGATVAVVGASETGQLIRALFAQPIQSSGSGFRAFKSFDALKRGLGSAGPGKVWHHIVEQRDVNIKRFGPEGIHNTRNVIAVDSRVNQKIADYYSRKTLFTGGKTVREWLTPQSFEEQYEFGEMILQRVLNGLELP